MRTSLSNLVKQHGIALAGSTTMVASVIYFHAVALGGDFLPIFLVPYISVVLIAYVSGLWLDRKLAPADSFLLNLYVVLLAIAASIIGAGLFFGTAVAIGSHGLLANPLLHAITFGSSTAIMFVWGAWPLLLPMAVASTVLVFLVRRSAANNSFKPNPLRGSA